MRHQAWLLTLNDAVPIHDMAGAADSDLPWANVPTVINMRTVPVVITTHRTIEHKFEIVVCSPSHEAHVTALADNRQ
jgi:hypothetical protein